MIEQAGFVQDSPTSVFNSVGIILGSVALILTVYHYWLQSLRYVKLGNQIPGLPPLPIIGNLHEAIGQKPSEIFDFVLDKYKRFGYDAARIWVGPRLIVGLGNPKDIELVLGSQIHLEKSQEYDFFKPWLGDGLLISNGEKWKSHRKMIAPTFHSSILKSFMPTFNKNANELVEKLKLEVGTVFDIHDHMIGITADILLETAMGFKNNTADKAGMEYAKAVMDMCYILHHRHYKVWLRPNFIFQFTKMAALQKKLLNTIHSLTMRVLKIKKEEYFERIANDLNPSLYKKAVKATEAELNTPQQTENYKYVRDDLEEIEENDVGEKKRLAFLDFMIEASQMPGNNLSDKDIKEEIDTIMFEGHDTTGAALSFVLCILGVHIDVQNKVIDELKAIFHDDFYRPVTFNDTLEMKYLERVIMETLRLYPPVPLISRKVSTEIKLVSGDYTVPAGTTVLITPYLAHRHPKFWENAETFDPDNFLPERCAQRHYYSYIPFSAGPRSCVGRKYAMLKLKVVLATVLRKFTVLSLSKENEFKLQADIILKRSDGFHIIIEERKVQ